MTRRKHVSLKTKLAAALLMMVKPGEDGKMAPVIPFAEAKAMTPEQIIGRFDFDHGTFVAIGGGNDPWNLTPRLRAEHREKTKRDLATIAKIKRGLRKRNPVRAATPCQWAEQGVRFSRPGPKRKSRAMPHGRSSSTKRKLSGEVIAR